MRLMGGNPPLLTSRHIERVSTALKRATRRPLFAWILVSPLIGAFGASSFVVEHRGFNTARD